MKRESSNMRQCASRCRQIKKMVLKTAFLLNITLIMILAVSFFVLAAAFRRHAGHAGLLTYARRACLFHTARVFFFAAGTDIKSVKTMVTFNNFW